MESTSHAAQPRQRSVVRFNEDATLNVEVGGQEIGQGAFTVAAQIAAEILGIPYDHVTVSSPLDTKYSPYEWQTVASRLTWSMGNAVKAAAEDARIQILDTVAAHWDEDVDDLTIKDGLVISFKSEREQPLEKMVVYGLPNENYEGWKGGPVVGRGHFMPTYVTNSGSRDRPGYPGCGPLYCGRPGGGSGSGPGNRPFGSIEYRQRL